MTILGFSRFFFYFLDGVGYFGNEEDLNGNKVADKKNVLHFNILTTQA